MKHGVKIKMTKKNKTHFLKKNTKELSNGN